MYFASTNDSDCDDSRFLFKNRKFLSIDQGLSVARGLSSTTSSSQYSGDSDSHSMDFSFSEDDEIEVVYWPWLSSYVIVLVCVVAHILACYRLHCCL